MSEAAAGKMVAESVRKILQDAKPAPTSQFSNDKVEVDAWAARRQVDKELERAKTFLKDSGIPQRHMRQLEAGFSPCNDTWISNQEKIENLLGQGGVIVAMLGRRGTGKTMAASVLVRERCMRGIHAAYISANEFYLDLRESYSEKAEHTEKAVLMHYQKPRLLVIDEVHERGDSTWSDRMLTFIVDQRYRDCKDTILIANQTPEEFAAAVGPSVVDRAKEGGGVLLYNWESFRGRP